MNYYQHHIGDFNSGTVRMPQLARWLYRDMIEVYYDTEKPLPADFEVLCMSIGAVGEDQRTAVKMVLTLKFQLRDDGYWHERCDAEIAKYHANADTARENGRKGGRPKKPIGNPEKPIGFPSGSHPVSSGNPEETGLKPNQEPITNNQEPETKGKTKPRAKRASSPDDFDPMAWLIERGVEQKHARDWLKIRKAGGDSATASIFEGIEQQVAEAGITMAEAIAHCAAAPWRGFKAKWWRDREQPKQSPLDLAAQVQRNAGPRNPGGYVSKQEQLERNNRAVAERYIARLKAEEAEKGNDHESE
ncbi:hypothetical protein CBA19CS22_37995 [Caballeronia novacaledonica]|uniref:Uncharacterized protein n=1 Tax=Caballeronia novacaledonica TaxID=1544861 RepID=A0ACB5R5W3_9BURK|nr:hypothetical protein CBA19CS22_37995 [Caballeronia novacaledonica]